MVMGCFFREYGHMASGEREKFFRSSFASREANLLFVLPCSFSIWCESMGRASEVEWDGGKGIREGMW